KRLQAAIAQVAKRGWHVQVFTRLSVIERVQEVVRTSPVPIVFDHFGGAQAALGVAQPGFNALLSLVRSGHCYVKISALYRSSTHPPEFADLAPLAKALIGANPERVLWGTDCPHTNQITGRPAMDVTPLMAIDDGRLMNLLPVWVPDAAT